MKELAPSTLPASWLTPYSRINSLLRKRRAEPVEVKRKNFMLRIPPSLHHKKFFYLWLGQLISITGTQMQIWALFWHISEIDKIQLRLAALA